MPPSIFKDFPGKVYSGDVHMPQHVAKNIEYVGAPYRCHFGDQFTPRVLLIHNDGRQEDLHFPCKSKHLLPVRNAHEFDMVAEALKIKEGDQVKVRVPMKRRDYPRWAEVRAELRQAAENWKVELYGIEMVAVETLGGRDHTGEASGLSSHASPVELMKAYAEKRKLGGEMVQLGLELMMGVKSGGDANQSEHGKPALR